MAKIIRFPRKKRPVDGGMKPLFGTDARPAKFASDAIALPDHPRSADEQAGLERARRLRRRRNSALAGLAVVFTLGSLAAIFGERGYLDVRRQRVAYRELKQEVAAHQARYQAIKKEVDTLGSDARSIERIAREDLGYAASGELVLLLPGPLDDDGRSAIVTPVPKAP